MRQMKSSPLIDNSTSRDKLAELVSVTAVLAVAAGVFAALFNRANVLSHSIGYNLYASERVLEGAVPYRDFHTLYPPEIFYLNADLFKWLGVSLYAALLGVLVFKVLTVLMIYLSARQLMPKAWALVSALGSLLWLRPNGPFKSVPMHYGALFLAAAMYFLLKYENRRKLRFVFLAGASLALVALFKHNIGAYALAGAAVVLVAEENSLKYTPGAAAQSLRRVLMLLFGFVALLVPALAYMQAKGALAPMIRTLAFGPGEFLLNRLATPLSPVAPLLLVAALAAIAYATHKLRGNAPMTAALWLVLIAAVSVFLLRGSQPDINQIIFYLPMLVLLFALLAVILGKQVPVPERRALLIVFVFAAAALMELFPRFAREQSIAAMPLAMLMLFYLLYVFRAPIETFAGGTLQYRLALAVLPLTFLLIEARTFSNTYFEGGAHFKASTQPTIERARGVYFPAQTAHLIDEVVNYLQERLPPGGYAFAQSDAGTSFLFLSDRRNISNAQFWIGVGVTPEERAATLERIDKSPIKLIITSDDMLAEEKYGPMRDYIDRNFRTAARFDDVLILER
jgi:Dolichyl-phosphate-mannose-protein mannosyltransferase